MALLRRPATRRRALEKSGNDQSLSRTLELSTSGSPGFTTQPETTMPYRMLVEQKHLDRASISLMISPARFNQGPTPLLDANRSSKLRRHCWERLWEPRRAGWQGPTGGHWPLPGIGGINGDLRAERRQVGAEDT